MVRTFIATQTFCCIRYQNESEDGIANTRIRDLEEFRREKLKFWTRDSYAFE